MGRAWIDGKAVAFQAATAEAARTLGAGRLPVIAGLGTDIAGVRAAMALAEQLGAAIDHMNSGTLFRDLGVMRDAGWMVTTPTEARLRADVLLMIGTGLLAAWPELPARLFIRPTAPEAGGVERHIVWLCAGRHPRQFSGSDANIRKIGRDPEDLPVLLAALRARVAGRQAGKTRLSATLLAELAADLQAARFGVAVWSAAELDALTIEMLCGLVKDLNGKTRFSGLPLAPGDNALGALQACGWITGFPMRTGFGRGYPEHDPWRFDATRLVETGEADCALWISAYRAAAPNWKRTVPMIALTRQGVTFPRPPRVHIEVGRPGIDHDAVEHLAATGTLAPVTATKPSELPTVAYTIAQIASAVPDIGTRSC
jgi:formylmethanofuran dehydrogenase subunit B